MVPLPVLAAPVEPETVATVPPGPLLVAGPPLVAVPVAPEVPPTVPVGPADEVVVVPSADEVVGPLPPPVVLAVDVVSTGGRSIESPVEKRNTTSSGIALPITSASPPAARTTS